MDVMTKWRFEKRSETGGRMLSFKKFSDEIRASSGVHIHPVTLQRWQAKTIRPRLERLFTILDNTPEDSWLHLWAAEMISALRENQEKNNA